MTDTPPCRAFDAATWVYMLGCRVLAAYGLGDRQARPILARWLRRMSAEALLPILVRAAAKERGSYVEYVERAIRGESDAEASSGAAPAPTESRTDGEKFARRVRGLQGAHMLHLLSPDEMARAEKAGLLPISAPGYPGEAGVPLSSALKRSQGGLKGQPAAAAPGHPATPSRGTDSLGD